jgi:hypothetical protein
VFIAKSGEGKTAAANVMVLSFLADNAHTSVVDIKGGEWNKLESFANLMVISMDDEDPKFVNTLRIDDMEATLEDAEYIYRTAVSSTVQLFSLQINLNTMTEGSHQDLEAVLEEAIVKYLDKFEVVSNNPNTFWRTAETKYEDILPYFQTLKTSNSYNEEKRRLCDIAYNRLGTFFRGGGRFGNAFRNELSLREVIDTPLVVYSFNKNNNTMLDSLDTLRLFMVQHLNAKKSYFRKRQGLQTVEVYEELARAEQFGKLLTYISHRISGSRSSNVTFILLLNTLSALDKPDAAAIKSNITTIVCGKVEKSDIVLLEKDYNSESILPYVRAISLSEDMRYKYCFAIRYDTGAEIDKAIYKVVMPSYMEEELRTRDVVNSI